MCEENGVCMCVCVCWKAKRKKEQWEKLSRKITTTACLLASTSDFPLSVSVSPFFLWLTCFFSCLLNIPGWEHNGNDLTSKLQNTKIHLGGSLWVMTTDNAVRTSHHGCCQVIDTTGISVEVWDSIFNSNSLIFSIFRLPPPPFSVDVSPFACGGDNQLCQNFQNGFPHPTPLDPTLLLTSVAAGFYFTELRNFRCRAIIKWSLTETCSCLRMPQIFTFWKKE